MSASLIVLYICLGVFIGLPCCLCCFAGIAYTIEEGRTRTIPDGKKDKRCVVKCLCGETEITLRNPKPRLKCECMCYDCKQRWDWQKSQGAKLGDYYEHWANKDQREEICEIYVDNSVVSIKGEENLKTWSLKEGSKMRMLTCDKCKFVMINSHELYNGVIVMVSAKHTEHEKIPIIIRGF